MKKLLLIFFSVTIMISGGKNSSEEYDSQNKSSQEEKENEDLLKVKKTINGVEYSLSINETMFELEDEIIVKGSVKNVSNHPIDYIGYNGCDDGLDVFVPVPKYERNFLEKGWDKENGQACTDAIEQYVLEVGEVIEESAVLVPKIHMGRGMDIPTGDYKTKLIFKRGGFDSTAEHDQNIELKLEPTSNF